MGDFFFYFAVINCIVVSTLLWLITFLGSFLYTTKHDQNREVHFECGFFSVNKLVPAYNLNFVVSAIFLLLYDIEFLLLIPYIFNIVFITNTLFYLCSLLVFVILFSLLLDIESKSIKWYYN